jgi:hypothetical protein
MNKNWVSPTAVAANPAPPSRIHPAIVGPYQKNRPGIRRRLKTHPICNSRHLLNAASQPATVGSPLVTVPVTTPTAQLRKNEQQTDIQACPTRSARQHRPLTDFPRELLTENGSGAISVKPAN